MSTFIGRIIDDLRTFSAELLETGLDDAGAFDRTLATTASTTTVIDTTHAIAGLVPALLAEQEAWASPTRWIERSTSTPTHTLSRRPWDYRRSQDGRLLPSRWLRAVPVEHVDLRAMRWLVHLLDRIDDRIEEFRRRNDKYVQDALAARGGTSTWGLRNTKDLAQIGENLDRARHAADRARRLVVQAAGRPLTPLASPPSPYPTMPAWITLRRLSSLADDDRSLLPRHLRRVLGPKENHADLPYLYQRWCGVKIVEALGELGWQPRSDPTGALYLGGCITFKSGAHSLDLWVEPLLPRKRTHPSGFRSNRGEAASPDFLFVTPGPGGLDAFCLDATLATDEQSLKLKGDYRLKIELARLATVAGCPVSRGPRLAWAVSPIISPHGRLHYADGTVGTVPLSPVMFDVDPLAAWLSEVARHALAWSLVDLDRALNSTMIVRPHSNHVRPAPPKKLEIIVGDASSS